MSDLTPEMEKNIRKNWVVGDWVEVYSKSRDQWFRAKIIEIYEDDDGEWLAVVVEDTMIKEVQRFTTDVRPIISAEEDSSDDDYSTSDSSSGESSGSLSDSESDGDEKERMAKKRRKAQKKLSKHHELVLVFVERAGTDMFNGKYVYKTTSEEGYPQFVNVTNEHVIIKQNEDEMQWEFLYKNKIYYTIESDAEFPPQAGWSKTKLGDLPNPGVRLDSMDNKEADDNFFEDDPYKFSPFLILKYKFSKVNAEPLGFDLQIIQLHSQFVAVKSIKPDSQAERFEVMPGDILVSANDTDLSKMRTIDQVSKAIEGVIKKLDEKKELFITFAREKQTFKVIMVQRPGTKHVAGKFSIQGKENDALMFANNDNVNLKILRIYVNEDEDESIWALREINIFNKNSKKKAKKKAKKKKKKKNKKSAKNKSPSDSSDYSSEFSDSNSSSSSEENHRDYYIVLALASDEVPPECGWEAVDPHGLWPAAGLQYYDVKLVPPSKPKIIRCQPNPNAVQIHFDCDLEGRKPKVCPHMEVWYEIEMRHYKYNIDKGKTSKKAHDTKIWRTKESPFVANRLTNGDDYEFIVRTCNHIASTNSICSKRITPLQLPPKPKITNITGKPGELYIHFHCANAKDREVQAKFEIIISPPIDESNQDYPIKEHRLLVDDDNKPVRLRNLVNGCKYQIIVASVNTVGVTYSESEEAYPSLEPPQPMLTKVEAGNREVIVYFKCEGYDKPDIKAWFEMELDPSPPSLDSGGIKARSDHGLNDDEKGNIQRGHRREKSRMRHKLARKSRWRRQTLSQKIILGSGGLSIGDVDDEKMNGTGNTSINNLVAADADDFVPYFRRNKRHYGSPVKISPLVNGVPYIVRVKAVTLSGSKISAFSQAVVPKGPPPMPKIMKIAPLESAVEIDFECNDYATKEYEAKFEIESFPPTITMKQIKTTPYIFRNLNNGWNYKFHVRAVNCEGKSKWSDRSVPATPLKIPPQPIELRLVPYDREITVYWVCEELKTPEYSGWYEVESEPKTFTMVVTRQQARFRRLKNGKKYTFKVAAVNQVGKAVSQVSSPGIPDDEITREQYLRMKKSVACEVKEVLLKIRREQKKQKAHGKLVKLKKQKKQTEKKDKEKVNKKIDAIMMRKKKKKKLAAKREKKLQQERDMKKAKMEEQRAKVLQNKRRISFLHRQRIEELQGSINQTSTNSLLKSKNTFKASSLMGRKGKKNKKKANSTMFGTSNKNGSKKNSKIGKSVKVRKGKALLPDSEINAILSGNDDKIDIQFKDGKKKKGKRKKKKRNTKVENSVD